MQSDEVYPPPRQAWYVVGVLTLMYVFSFIDRQILNLLVQPIRRDLKINDTQMSLLMGFSFAVFYTFFGILLGRWADGHSRRSLVAVGCIFWSLMTTCCGLARTFGEMLVLRMGVGVGEAALSPAAYSLITDCFPRDRRATAFGVYSMGIYIGAGLAFVLGGAVIELASGPDTWNLPLVGATRPWQVIFFFVGLPGVLCAMLMYTFAEPMRHERHGAAQVSLSEAAAYIRANTRTFLGHNLGFALLAFSGYSATAWVPTIFVRVHGWSSTRAGLVYGSILAIAGTFGVLAGGRLADHWTATRGWRDATIRVGIVAGLVWLPFGVLFPLVPNATHAVVLLTAACFAASAPFGVAPAAIQQIVPNAMRGQASALYLFVINLIGLGLGPTAVAATTDYVFRDDRAVNYSLAIVTVVANLLAAAILWWSLPAYRVSVERLKKWRAQPDGQ